jgi:hypothetical protein
MQLREREGLLPWVVAVGAGAGTAAFAILRFTRRRRTAAARGALDTLEESAVEVLRRDRLTGNCAIDVAALGPGIIELSGIVPTLEIGQRAARLLHALDGVRTVVNRLETGSLEDHLAENRLRRARGEPALRERQWYGMSVGTGRRRQSPNTESGRDDDIVEQRMRELDVHEADVADAVSPDGLSGSGNELQH